MFLKLRCMQLSSKKKLVSDSYIFAYFYLTEIEMDMLQSRCKTWSLAYLKQIIIKMNNKADKKKCLLISVTGLV